MLNHIFYIFLVLIVVSILVYMKKKDYKKVFISGNILMTLFLVNVCFLYTDIRLIENGKSPIFSVVVANHNDGGSVQYTSLGYRIKKNNRIKTDAEGEKHGYLKGYEVQFGYITIKEASTLVNHNVTNNSKPNINIKIEDGKRLSCDLLLNVNGYVYPYSFKDPVDSREFHIDEYELVYEKYDLVYNIVDEETYYSYKLGVKNGLKSIWLGTLEVIILGDSYHYVKDFEEEESIHFVPPTIDKTEEVIAGFIKSYNYVNNSIDIQMGDAIDYDTYTAIGNLSETLDTYSLSNDVVILLSWPEVYVDLNTFINLVNNNAFNIRPTWFVIDDNKVTAIQEFHNP